MTQDFFARLLEHHWLAAVSRDKGRFRAFLLAALNHFLANEWDRRKAQKRGGGQQLLSLDAQAAETSYQREPSDNVSAETIYERRWALTLLDLVMHRLEAEYAADGKADLFVKLKFALTGERSVVPYASLAAENGLSESAIKVAVHRLRQRYRELLRAEIAQTVANPGEVDGELRYLIKVISG
jgi:RNA polymerase sigma-70 factor (ECF subfamily)